MSKPLFTLCISFGDVKLPVFFEEYNVLLSTKAALVDAGIPGITAEEDSTTRHVFLKPSSAVAHLRLWVDSLAGHAREEVQPEEETTEGVGRKEETLALMKRAEGVTLDELAHRFGILRNSASALPGLAARKFGYEVVKSNGRYTAVKKSASSASRRTRPATASKAGAASGIRPSSH